MKTKTPGSGAQRPYISPNLRIREVSQEVNFLASPGASISNLQDAGWDGDSLWEEE